MISFLSKNLALNVSSKSELETYFVKNLAPNFGELLATNPSALHSKPYGSGSGQYIGTPPNNPGASGSYLTGSIDLSLIHI